MVWNVSHLENLSHIAYEAGVARYYSGNFMADRSEFIAWAEEFSRRYAEQEKSGWADMEWIDTIDAFIAEKLNTAAALAAKKGLAWNECPRNQFGCTGKAGVVCPWPVPGIPGLWGPFPEWEKRIEYHLRGD